MSTPTKEMVLITGATGNIGVSTIIAALRQNKSVLAIVRNKASADKIFSNLDVKGETLNKDDVRTVEADVTSEGDDGIKGVVEKVKKGELPSFQHVYSTVGFLHNSGGPIQDISLKDFKDVMQINLYGNFLTYKYTIPYLLSLPIPTTFTLITGAAGTFGAYGVTAVSQGALFSLAAVGGRELADTNVRFNEVYLAYRVDYDSVVDRLIEKGKMDNGMGQSGSRMRASEFARTYEEILQNGKVKGMRVNVRGWDDLSGKNVQRLGV